MTFLTGLKVKYQLTENVIFLYDYVETFSYVNKVMKPLFLYPHINRGGGYWNHFVHLSVCPPVHVPDFVRTILPELLNSFVWWYIIYNEVECQEQKLIHYLQCEGHSERL